MSLGSLSGAAQAMQQPTAGGESLKFGRDASRDPPEAVRHISVKAKVRLAGGCVMLLLLLVTGLALALNRIDIGLDEGLVREVQRELAQSSAASSGAVDARDILDDAQREVPRVPAAPPT